MARGSERTALRLRIHESRARIVRRSDETTYVNIQVEVTAGGLPKFQCLGNPGVLVLTAPKLRLTTQPGVGVGTVNRRDASAY